MAKGVDEEEREAAVTGEADTDGGGADKGEGAGLRKRETVGAAGVDNDSLKCAEDMV